MNEQWVLPIIDETKCVFCGQCIDTCPHSVLRIDQTNLVFENPQACTYCGECESVCPENAIACPLEIIWQEDNP